MTFNSIPSCINYVQFTLSDGTTSPKIQTKDGRMTKKKTLTFEANAAHNISSVKGHGSFVAVHNLLFFGANREKVAFYDPGGKIWDAKNVHRELTLAKNEKIIGFYGTFGSDRPERWFKNLGLMVRVQS